MNRILSAIVTASALIVGIFLPREDAVAQSAKELVGTWTLVSSTLELDGKKVDLFGPNPRGKLIFDPNGSFSYVSAIVTRPGLSILKLNQTGANEETKAVVSFFGMYSVSDAGHTLNFHVEVSTFPNWNGGDQKRRLKLSGDELTLTKPTPFTGSGNASSVWKRTK